MRNINDDKTSEHTYKPEQEIGHEAQIGIKSPWNPSIFYLLTFFSGFGAAGILAGINNKRLGKPELKWLTIGVSLATFVGYLSITVFYGVGYEVIFYLANFIPTIILERIQRPHYKRWKEQITLAGRSGWGVPAIITISSIAIVFVVSFIVAMAITPWSISDIGYVRSISEGELVQGNLSNNRDVDAYSFDAVQGEIYLIRTAASSSDNALEDSYLTLWYADGVTILAANDDYEGSLHACIEWKAESTGTFFITVESADLVSYGDYILTVDCISR